MSVINPQSILSSRNLTNHIFRANETRKHNSLNREKINMNFNKSERINRFELEGGLVDESKLNQNNNSYQHSPNIKSPKDDHSRKRNSGEIEIDRRSINFDDQIYRSNPSCCHICCNRILYSKYCISLYIGLLFVSIVVFVYSICGYFANMNELPIVVCEIVLTIVIIIDMLIRIYNIGCKMYFNICLNWLDLVLLMLSLINILLYLTFQKAALQIEEISLALLIFIRNSFQLLRLIVLLKNQKLVRKNIEEIIRFTSEINQKNQLDKIGTYKKKNNNDALSILDGNWININNKREIESQKFSHFENEII